jgi:superfamily II DNA/RNA helicase
MPESPEAIEAAILTATSPGFRNRLLARGEARGMIWRDGVPPENAPTFASLLSYDLLSYGYSLLGHGLRLVEAGGSRKVSQQAFENAATAIEAVIARGPATDDRGFHRVVAAASYHLGSFSARAYSLLHAAQNASEITICERCLILLMRRDLDGLVALVSSQRDAASDDRLVETLRGVLEPGESDEPADGADSADVIDVVDLALTDAFVGAFSVAMLAFERGDGALLEDALGRLQVGLEGAGELNLVPQWWCHRLAIHLLRGLWEASFYTVLPPGPVGGGGEWARLRAMFIASLFRRSRSEIDLWPSQLEAAARVLDTRDNLVLSLPTSAGKTRIAELCILACLAEGRRVVFVTPLRALSAQTETALERTFVPLGKTVSTLYGTTGVSGVDEDILRERDIIVATPEKLDFALRNDPSLLDDVGLVVLDEGHMIGDGEREVRYEIQVQRLLRRPDAVGRRIICLSAILPDGEQVQDFVGWLTDDRPGGLITSPWRPTKLRFGEIIWQGDHARLSVIVGDEEPFVPRFLEQSVPPGKRRTFPKGQQELTLATAWQLIDDGQTVLIFCPQKASVTSFAKLIVTLHRQGALRDVFEGDPDQLSTALTIGEEWFGPGHPILACLRLGIAIHHGSLPTPYRKEVERLLQQGTLKITVSSPTLAQGLNLSASALIVHSIWRNRRVIETSEFRNIVGRAGRAFVDSAGIVLHPIYDNFRRKRQDWRRLVEDTALRDMQSGLMQLVIGLLARMQDKLGTHDLDALIDYVAGNAAWAFPEIPSDDDEATELARHTWRAQIASLDCALLSLLSETVVTGEGIEEALDDALASSLWTRSIARRQEPIQAALRAGLAARARTLWSQTTPAQRRGYYLAGVGLETGHQLDEHADALNQHLHDAEVGILSGEDQSAIEAVTCFASIALDIHPFAPKTLPEGWEAILAGWLQGTPVSGIIANSADERLEFIEGTLAYRLPWALEAVRVRAAAHGNANPDPWALVAPDQGLAVAAVEAGTLDRSAALLMRAGFPTRSGALAAVQSGDGRFETLTGLHQWLNSEGVRRRMNDPNWPTQSTHELWTGFLSRSAASHKKTWVHTVELATVSWLGNYTGEHGIPYRAVFLSDTETVLETSDAHRVGILEEPLNPGRLGLLTVTGTSAQNIVELSYRGPSGLRSVTGTRTG